MAQRIAISLFLFSCLGVSRFASFTSAQEVLVFGPETFVRSKGDTETFVRTFSLYLPLQNFTISVQNGEGRHGPVSSAVVHLNGTQILGPSDFNQNVDLVTRPVSLQSQNTLNVELRSAPGRAIVVTVTAEFPSTTGTIPATGGSISLNGLAFVTFPDGAFQTSMPVRVSATNSAQTHEDFSATAEGPRIPYEIRINSGTVPPITPFEVILNVPEGFADSFLPERQLEIFAQPIESGSIENLGHFQGFSSQHDPVSSTVTALLPPEAFTNEHTTDGTYEAILIIGDIPKYPATSGSQSSISIRPTESAKSAHVMLASLNLIGLLAASTSLCEGSPLGSPLEGTLTVSGPFNPPTHNGTDYAAPLGTSARPVLAGRVTKIGFDLRKRTTPHPRTGLMVQGWGRYVVITHGDGSQTLYAHLVPESTSHLVEAVTEVTPTDTIGQVGVSGGVTGPHLHLEYSPEGRIFVRRSLRDPHPCILAGQQPLVLNPQNPSLTCPNGTVQFTASGGQPPYTWSSSAGVRTVTGVNSENMTLSPPATSAGAGGTAYNVKWGEAACTFPFSRLFFFRRLHDCDGQPTGTFLMCSVSDQIPGCDPTQPCASWEPRGPVACGEGCGGIGGACNAPGGTCTGHVPASAIIVNHRTPEMIAAGCEPCDLAFKEGLTVTVQDAASTPVSVPVQVIFQALQP